MDSPHSHSKFLQIRMKNIQVRKNGPKLLIFLEWAFLGEYYAAEILKHVDKEPSDYVLIVQDNASAAVGAGLLFWDFLKEFFEIFPKIHSFSGIKVTEKHPHISTVPDLAHCINLAGSSIGKILPKVLKWKIFFWFNFIF